MQSTCVDGFVIEAGPNGFLNREPQTLALVEMLGLTSRLIEARSDAKRRYIVRGGRLCQVPDGPATLVTSPALSWRGKLRLLAEPFAAGPPADEESVHAFATRRLGTEVADVLVDAAVGGITAGDSRRLSVEAQFPRLVEMERTHGSLLRALFARPPAGAPPTPSKLLSFDQGMGVLISALARRLGPAINTGSPVRSLARRDGAWQVATNAGEVIAADHVVLAVPARHAAPMVEPLDGALSAALATFEYAGLVVVALAYRAADVPRPLDGYGYLTTRPEGLATLGVVWESSLFRGRAPDGMVLLRVMLGGSRRPDLVNVPAGEAIAVARAELQTVLGISAAPAHVVVHAWPQAIAQYTLGHRQRCTSVRAWRRGIRGCGCAARRTTAWRSTTPSRAGARRRNASPSKRGARARRRPRHARKRRGCKREGTTARGSRHLRRAADAGLRRSARLLVAHPARADPHGRRDPGAGAAAHRAVAGPHAAPPVDRPRLRVAARGAHRAAGRAPARDPGRGRRRRLARARRLRVPAAAARRGAAQALPGDEPVWVAPMYAADSAFTHALSRETVRHLSAAAPRPAPIMVLPALDGERLATLSVAHVREQTADDGWHGPDVALVLAAHGTLLAPEKPIDTGLAATEALAAGHRRAPRRHASAASSTAGSITPGADGGPSRRLKPPWPTSRRRASGASSTTPTASSPTTPRASWKDGSRWLPIRRSPRAICRA